VLVFFVNGNAESPRAIAGHLGIGEVPDQAAVTSDGDAKVLQDERIRLEMDSRPTSTGVRLVDRSTGGTIARFEVDFVTGQAEVQAALSVRLTSPSRVSIEAPAVTINGRPVLPNGKPI
jgi:hypothetical protein